MEVVGSFERTVGDPPAGVVGQDLCSPGNDSVHDLVVFGLFGNEWGVGDLLGGVVIHQK